MSNDEPKAEDRVGATVASKYELLRLLGEGGMGAVYEAHHAYTDRRVALKLLHAHFAKNPAVRERFLREAKAAGALQHRCIANVLDAGADVDGTLYVVFEFLDGEDLACLIEDSRITPRRLLDVLIDVLSGLEAAHGRGIIHRDVKPANIYIVRERDGGQHAKLLDFGVARVTERRDQRRLTQAGTVVGTPYYMSPEQMYGEDIDGRADLWAVGVVLFLGLTGRLPFQSKNYTALATEMLQVGPPTLSTLRPDLPPILGSVVSRALNPTIDSRYADAAEMSDGLKEARLAFSRPDDAPRVVPVSPMTTRAPAKKTTEVAATPARPAWEKALDAIEDQIDAIATKPAPEEPEPPPRKKSRFTNPFRRKK
ncbi:MAG: serine/threonine-protein kinase [Deltaproteobacteria bacterium]|jgi:serine/threonine protein kinase